MIKLNFKTFSAAGIWGHFLPVFCFTQRWKGIFESPLRKWYCSTCHMEDVKRREFCLSKECLDSLPIRANTNRELAASRHLKPPRMVGCHRFISYHSTALSSRQRGHWPKSTPLIIACRWFLPFSQTFLSFLQHSCFWLSPKRNRRPQTVSSFKNTLAWRVNLWMMALITLHLLQQLWKPSLAKEM